MQVQSPTRPAPTPSPPASPKSCCGRVHSTSPPWLYRAISRARSNPTLLDDPLLAETVPAALRDVYRRGDGWDPRIEQWLVWQRTLAGPNLEAVRALAATGVPMLTGTDGGNFGVFQGYSVHRELKLLAKAGLSPWAALRAATTDAARFLDRRWGVEPGDEATLLVLDASPVEAIANTKRVRAVIQRGAVADREALRSWR